MTSPFPSFEPPLVRRWVRDSSTPARHLRALPRVALLLCFVACGTSPTAAESGAPVPDFTGAPNSGDGTPAPNAGDPAGDRGSSAEQGMPSREGAEDLPVSAPGADSGEGSPSGEPSGDDVGEDGEPALPNEPAANLFTDLLGIPEAEVNEKLDLAVRRVFGIGTGEPATPVQDAGYRLYYELPQDRSMAFIWTPDTQDIRSEGMSYGMMIAVQMGLQAEFDHLWRFAKTFMQHAGNSGLTSWRYYFRWVGRVSTQNANDWAVTYGANTGPAPDGEEYFAAALYLADLRWGSGGAFNYRQDADDLARAMLDNPRAQGRTPVIHPEQDMVVFFPNGGSANYSDPSYHLPAFYDLFALEGPPEHAERWRRIAERSRAFLVQSAHPQTGLHPDYANFDGSPNRGSGTNDRFQFDAWRVPLNMGLDHAWFAPDERMRQQATKYHEFFSTRLRGDNVENQLFDLDGGNASGGGSTALTASLAAAAHASSFPDRARFVQNLWDIDQQSGLYRYYQETVYVLGLLATAGRLRYDVSDAP